MDRSDGCRKHWSSWRNGATQKRSTPWRARSATDAWRSRYGSSATSTRPRTPSRLPASRPGSSSAVGAALLAWAWPAGTGFTVYRDPCQWSTTIPETSATTPEEIAAAFTTQAETSATAPVDITVDGYAGKAVTLSVPMSYHVPGATREEKFADCDEATFGYYGIEGGTEPERNAQGAGQVDELWILDFDGAIVILDATYSPATPASLVEELRAMAESATFRGPGGGS